MSPEQPKKIEKLLERYAKKRREQGDSPSLHPATRRLLQGEVTRQFADQRKRGSSWLDWLGAWRARLAVAATVIVALGVGVWSMRDGSRQTAGVNDPRVLSELGRAARADKEVVAKRELAALSDASKPLPTPADEKEIRVGTVELLANTPAPAPAAIANPTATVGLTISGDAASLAASDSAVLAPKGGAIDSLNRQSAANTERLQRLNEVAVRLETNVGVAANFTIDQPVQFFSVAPAIQSANQSSAAAGNEFGLLTNTGLFANTKPVSLNGVTSPASTETMREQQAPEAFKKIVEYDVAKTGSQTGLAYQNKDVQEQSQDNARPSSSQLVQNSPQQTKQDGAAFGGAGRGAVGQRVAQPQQSKAGASENQIPQTPPSGVALANNAPLYYRQTAPVQVAPVEQKLERGVERLPTLMQGDPMAGRVLSRFTVEHRGQTIRFVDVDDSVYEGPVAATQDSGRITAIEAEKLLDRDENVRAKIAPSSTRMIMPATYSFRAIGTNRTRGEPVVVNGRITGALLTRAELTTGAAVAPANSGLVSPARPAEERARSLAPASAPSVASTNVTRIASGPTANTNAVAIEGTIRVGEAPEQPFKAVPAPR